MLQSYIQNITAEYISTRSSFLLNLKYADNAITASNSKSLSRITEVTGEARSTQVIDSVARLEERVAIEYFHLVGSTASCHDQVVCVLLKLGAVQLHRFVRG